VGRSEARFVGGSGVADGGRRKEINRKGKTVVTVKVEMLSWKHLLLKRANQGSLALTFLSLSKSCSSIQHMTECAKALQPAKRRLIVVSTERMDAKETVRPQQEKGY